MMFPNNRFIKSWFGFYFGMFTVAISLYSLIEDFTLSKVLSSLGFLLFWYPWSQMTHWHNPLNSLFNFESQAISKSNSYLIVIAMFLIIGSALLRFIN